MLAEQQIATSVASVRTLTEAVADLRRKLDDVTGEVDRMRRASDEALQAFEQMRKPLEGLLDMRQRLRGGWLVVLALLMMLSYLAPPLLNHFVHTVMP